MYTALKIKYIESISVIINDLIKKELIEYFRLNLNVEMISKWNRYLKYFGINYSLKWILSKIVETLEFTISNDSYIVKINNNIRINGYNLNRLSKLIEYGNNEIKGTKLIGDSFEYLKENINNIISREVG